MMIKKINKKKLEIKNVDFIGAYNKNTTLYSSCILFFATKPLEFKDFDFIAEQRIQQEYNVVFFVFPFIARKNSNWKLVEYKNTKK